LEIQQFCFYLLWIWHKHTLQSILTFITMHKLFIFHDAHFCCIYHFRNLPIWDRASTPTSLAWTTGTMNTWSGRASLVKMHSTLGHPQNVFSTAVLHSVHEIRYVMIPFVSVSVAARVLTDLHPTTTHTHARTHTCTHTQGSSGVKCIFFLHCAAYETGLVLCTKCLSVHWLALFSMTGLPWAWLVRPQDRATQTKPQTAWIFVLCRQGGPTSTEILHWKLRKLHSRAGSILARTL
jgi:hypothetical protein